MRILLLTFYFRPDLSAPSFRVTALVDALVEQGHGEVEIDVFTTLPNRYHSYRVHAAEQELNGNIRIFRFPVPAHRNGVIDQVRAFASYAYQVVRTVAGKRYDMVFATSARLMTAVLSAFVANRLSVPLYLDIRDIFVEVVEDMFSGRALQHVVPALKVLERYALRSAAKVNIVSGGFEDYFRSLIPPERLSSFTNGIDPEFLNVSYVNPDPNPLPLILYAGNVGEGQGLHRIVPEAARRLNGQAEFLIVGDGGARKKLEAALAAARVTNVRLEPPVPRSQLVQYYRRADILFLHLNNYDAFRRVLPSRVFEYAATGKPVLAGVRGYARQFIVENVTNAAVFDPCDAEGLVRALRSLEMHLTPRNEFIRRFVRTNIAAAMARDVLGLVQSPFSRSHRQKDSCEVAVT